MAPAARARRTLRFQTLNDVRDDCRRLAGGATVTVGQWSFAQILEHLAQSMDGCYIGFDFAAPWPVRKLVTWFLRRRILSRPMSAGFRLPGRARSLIPPDCPELPSALAHLEQSLSRIEREPPTHPHPVLGLLTQAELHQLTLRHAELHLSFVVPATSAAELA